MMTATDDTEARRCYAQKLCALYRDRPHVRKSPSYNRLFNKVILTDRYYDKGHITTREASGMRDVLFFWNVDAEGNPARTPITDEDYFYLKMVEICRTRAIMTAGFLKDAPLECLGLQRDLQELREEVINTSKRPVGYKIAPHGIICVYINEG